MALAPYTTGQAPGSSPYRQTGGRFPYAAAPPPGPPSGLERFAHGFVRTLVPGFHPERLTRPPKLGGWNDVERQARATAAGLRATWGNLNTAEGAGAASAALLPWKAPRWSVPEAVERGLLNAASEQGKVMPLLGPERGEFGMPGAPFATSREGVPLEAFSRPPRVEEFMAPGELSVARVVNEVPPHEPALTEEMLDSLQDMLNARWDAVRRESVGRRDRWNFQYGNEGFLVARPRRRSFLIPLGVESALRRVFNAPPE